VSVVLFASFIGIMLLGAPVTFTIGAASLIAFFLGGFGDSAFVLPQQILEGVDNPAMLSIPFFILAGNLMNAVGVTDRIFAFALVLAGRFRGGLCQVGVIATAIFSGVSGSALADIAGLGGIQAKAMKEKGYPAEFSAALTVASSVMAPIKPPSIAFIVYASLANVSVGRMFVAGVVPSIILIIALMVCNRVLAGARNYPKELPIPAGRAFGVILGGLPALGAPAIILIGTIGGYATTTEGAVLASIYSLALGAIYKSFSLAKLWDAIKSAVEVSALIMIIIGFSHFMSYILAIEQAPQHLASMALSLTHSPVILMLVLVAFLLFIGCFLESAPAKLILVPVLLPVLDYFGIDRIQFGVVLTFALALGIAHPPMGLGLFVVSRVVDVSLERVTVAILPFMVPLVAVLLIVALVPGVSTWLPNHMLGTTN
jgi:tripartite ATP-independent transporter DctM subunit